jgi:hypothetical protein
MNSEVVKRLEHISLRSDLDLQIFGEIFQKALTLPAMAHDYENETEWLDVDYNWINYNISKPYEEGTLQEWDDTVPERCNFGIVLCIHKDHPYVLNNIWVDNMVAGVCRQLAKAFDTSVYHHRTITFGIDKSVKKNIVFNP